MKLAKQAFKMLGSMGFENSRIFLFATLWKTSEVELKTSGSEGFEKK